MWRPGGGAQRSPRKEIRASADSASLRSCRWWFVEENLNFKRVHRSASGLLG